MFISFHPSSYSNYHYSRLHPSSYFSRGQLTRRESSPRQLKMLEIPCDSFPIQDPKSPSEINFLLRHWEKVWAKVSLDDSQEDLQTKFSEFVFFLNLVLQTSLHGAYQVHDDLTCFPGGDDIKNTWKNSIWPFCVLWLQIRDACVSYNLWFELRTCREDVREQPNQINAEIHKFG